MPLTKHDVVFLPPLGQSSVSLSVFHRPLAT